jgi:hypothetical protein
MSPDAYMSRRRGSLLSVSRGSRSIASVGHESTLLVGTCVSSGTNELRVFAHGDDPSSLLSRNIYECPAEIWGICPLIPVLGQGARGGKLVAVAARKNGTSSLALWQLPSIDSPLPPTPSGDLPNLLHCPLDVKCERKISGKALSIDVLSNERLIVSTSNVVSVVAVDSASTSLTVERSVTVDAAESIISAVSCAADSAIAIASRSKVSLYDSRTADDQGLLLLSTVRKQIRSSTTESSPDSQSASSEHLSVYPERLRTSAIASGSTALIVVGDEDGTVFGLDARLASARSDSDRSIIWSSSDVSAHSNWVTSLSVGPRDEVVSGGADGVVRAWSSSGQSVGVYPLHDDTIYGTAWLGDGWGFASVSYDGRLAVNARPVGIDD